MWPNWRWIVSGIATVVVLPVIGQFFIEVADDAGLYNDALAKVRVVISAITSHPAFSWIAATVVGFAVGVWVDAITRRRARPKPLSPLEMRFDTSNPHGRFWSAQTWHGKDGSTLSGIEYRVEVVNNTDVTIEDVVLTTEILTATATNPGSAEFVRNRQSTIDVHPHSSELGIILLIRPGERLTADAVIVRARAKNTAEVSLRFRRTDDGMSLALDGD